MAFDDGAYHVEKIRAAEQVFNFALLPPTPSYPSINNYLIPDIRDVVEVLDILISESNASV